MANKKEYVKAPVKTFLGMGLFLLLLALVPWTEWSMGPANLSWGTWILCYFSYVVLIITAVVWVVVKDKEEAKENK